MADSVNKSQFIVSSLNLLKIKARPSKQAPNQSARKYIIHLLGKYFNSISIILQTATNLRFPTNIKKSVAGMNASSAVSIIPLLPLNIDGNIISVFSLPEP